MKKNVRVSLKVSGFLSTVKTLNRLRGKKTVSLYMKAFFFFEAYEILESFGFFFKMLTLRKEGAYFWVM